MLDISVLYPVPLCALVFLLVRKWRKPTLQYPPSPKGYPIIGNVLDLPMNVPLWESFVSLANRQGTDILYLRLLGTDMVVLNSNEAISDLIEKRSSIYADRPQPPMMQLSGTPEWAFAMMPYGARWKARRRLCNDVLNVRMTGEFDSHQYKYACRLLSRLVEAPECFIQELEFTPGATMLSVTYGLDVKSIDDRFLGTNLAASRALASAMMPGKFLVDVIPILRYIPDWFPGVTFKAVAKEARDKYKISIDEPMEYVKSAMKSGGKFSHSITSDCLSRLEDGGRVHFDDEVIRDVSGVLFGAAAETTKSALKTFFLAMVLHPEAMKKAQEELDRVLKKGHLPDFSHRDSLPYIDAVVKEVLRWSPPLPIGIPYRVTQNDVYRGYFIPAGATVIQNIWAIFRDPEIYPQPETFNPDRFLKDGKINPLVFNPEDRVFGSGRRICPGSDFALRMLYLIVSRVLTVFDIEAPLDESGNPLPPKAEFESLVGRAPKPFKCTIKPRSDDAARLAREAYSGVNV